MAQACLVGYLQGHGSNLRLAQYTALSLSPEFSSVEREVQNNVTVGVCQ